MVMVFFYASLIIMAIISLWTIINMPKINKLATAILIPFVISMSVAAYFTIDGVKGYPTNRTIPDKFQLVWYTVDEPIAIYLWIIEKKSRQPRSYAIHYSKETHKKLEDIRKQLKSNEQAIQGEVKDKKPGTKTEQNLDIVFHTLPHPVAGIKDYEQ